MENNSKKVKRTVLSSMEEVISLAKKYSLEPEFYENAAAALKHISNTKLDKGRGDVAFVLHRDEFA